MNQKCAEQIGNAIRVLFRNPSAYVARATEKGEAHSLMLNGEHLGTLVEDEDEPGCWHVTIALLVENIASRQPARRR